MSTIVIVSSGQPGGNPRIVKEASALSGAGFVVTVVYVPLSPLADPFDEKIIYLHPQVNWVRTGYHSKNQPFHYKLARLRRKFYEKLSQFFPFVPPQYSFVLFSQELEWAAASIKADLYIGHNLGALPAAVKAAKKWNAKAAFDAEDFHRGEDHPATQHAKQARRMEDTYLPQLTYLSTASPLISARYQQLYPALSITTINNVFSKAFLQPLKLKSAHNVKLFWFSQTAGPNRGLEIVINALNQLPELPISFTILGDCSHEYREKLTRMHSIRGRISFLPPVPPEKVFELAAASDIGMATEVPYVENRDLCLTNKLFTYLLAGNCIVASNTAAQKDFLERHPGIGVVYKNDDATDLANKLRQLIQQPRQLQSFREQAHQVAANELNWEQESEKLIKLIKKHLN